MASGSTEAPLVEKLVRFSSSDNGQRVILVAFSIAATIVLVLLSGTAWAYAFGMPMIFFVPGFAVVRLFFWRKTTLEARFVLSLGLSVVAVILLGLVLVLTPIGLRNETTIASLIIFTLGAVALETLWLHAGRPAKKDEKRPQGSAAQAALTGTGASQSGPEKLDKVVAAMVVAALVVSGISLGLIVTAHYPSRTYFAMTDANGSADINTTLWKNTTFTLLLEVKNGEGGTRAFTIQFHEMNTTGPHYQNATFQRSLVKNEIWNQTFTLLLDTQGVHRLDFDLYLAEIGKEPTLYGSLHLWINVL